MVGAINIVLLIVMGIAIVVLIRKTMNYKDKTEYEETRVIPTRYQEPHC